MVIRRIYANGHTLYDLYKIKRNVWPPTGFTQLKRHTLYAYYKKNISKFQVGNFEKSDGDMASIFLAFLKRFLLLFRSVPGILCVVHSSSSIDAKNPAYSRVFCRMDHIWIE